jgi:hypothetical protein
MKKYDRAKQKRLGLISINEYTTRAVNDKEILFNRKNKQGSFSIDKKNNGEGWNQSRRSGSSDWRSTPQHQQDYAGEGSCIDRLSVTDSGVPRPGSRIKATKKIDEAA